jgi:quercetin dioxygenase-like cupin family protein
VQISRGNSDSYARGEAETFTGTVWVRRALSAPAPSEMGVVVVDFEPGARTFWHSHRGGQFMFVVSGRGRTGTRDGSMEEISAGDAVWIGPGEEHWHGAAPDSPMTHFAVNAGGPPAWAEEVSDVDYARSDP